MSNQPVSVVTGGAGFIGSHLVDTLLDVGHFVRVVDNLSTGRESNLQQHSNNPSLVCDWQDVRNVEPSSSIFSGADFCFHLAGLGEIVPSIDTPTRYMDINVQGTIRILEAARYAQTKKFVYAASSSCYGLAATPTAEDHPISPQYPYALSKYMGELAVFHWQQVYGLPVNVVCIFNAYGTRAKTSGAYGAVFGVFLKQKLAGTPFTVVGDGTQTRDFLYVTDVARAFLTAATSETKGERFNLGAGKPQSINRLVELLEGEVINLPKRPGEPDCTHANISKICRTLGWTPTVSFEDGVSMMLANIDYWGDAPLWDKSSIAKATKNWFQQIGTDKQEIL